MAIRMCEDVVTRQDRRRQARMKGIDTRAKRDRARTRIVRHYHEAQEIEFTDAVVTGKAFIEALDWKHRKGSPSRADMKMADELRATTEWYIRLARKVTRYISRERNGFIWGDSLEDLYEEIAEAPSITVEDSEITAEDVRFAVDIAVSRQLLRRQEASGIDMPEWTCIETFAA